MPSRDGPPFDLLVQGGAVLDPATGRSGRYDVAVRDGSVASVEPAIEGSLAAEVLDARGCVVTPGLVDLHTHLFFPGTYWGTDPVAVAWRTGVTSWVDAGSAGAYNLGALRRLAELPVALGVRAFVNISAVGLVAETGESAREELCDAGLCIGAIEGNRDFVVGVKVRMDHFAVGGNGLGPLRKALHAAEVTGVPVMVHIGAGPPGIDDVLDLLRPGDIVTHCTTGQSMSLVDGSGRLRPSAVAAHERGVLLDVGHGSGAFSFAVAEAMLDAGVLPDVISSDLHQRSVLGPGFDLPTCMSKYVALGMPLEQVVAAVTVNPERALAGAPGTARPVGAAPVGAAPDGAGPGGAGSLAVGRRADIAIFEIEDGDFVLYDTHLQSRRADRLLVNRATLAAGAVLAPVPPSQPAQWVSTTESQRELLARSAPELRRPWVTRLTKAGDFVPMALERPLRVSGEA